MNIRKIEIDGREYTIKANALLPRRYRNEFGKDLVTELNKFSTRCKNGEDIDWCVAENLTYLMIKTAGVEEIGTLDEWLEGIEDTFAIPRAFGEVLSLWAEQQETTSVPLKK